MYCLKWEGENVVLRVEDMTKAKNTVWGGTDSEGDKIELVTGAFCVSGGRFLLFDYSETVLWEEHPFGHAFAQKAQMMVQASATLGLSSTISHRLLHDLCVVICDEI